MAGLFNTQAPRQTDYDDDNRSRDRKITALTAEIELLKSRISQLETRQATASQNTKTVTVPTQTPAV